MVLTAFCTALVMAAGVFVLLPLFRKSAAVADWGPAAGGGIDTLLERKEAVYRTLRDLELDYAVGRLTGEDYRRLQADGMREAAGILGQLERSGVPPDLEASIEREIASRKSAGAPGAAGPPKSSARCPNCGAAGVPGKKFCADCGHKL